MPGGAEHHGLDRGLEPGIGVADDQLNAAEAGGLERAQERVQNAPSSEVADVEPEDLAPPVSGNAGRDHDRLEDDPVLDARFAVGGIDKHMAERLLGQAAVPKRRNPRRQARRRSCPPRTC